MKTGSISLSRGGVSCFFPAKIVRNTATKKITKIKVNVKKINSKIFSLL
jgi:hypothetical protein